MQTTACRHVGQPIGALSTYCQASTRPGTAIDTFRLLSSTNRMSRGGLLGLLLIWQFVLFHQSFLKRTSFSRLHHPMRT